MKNSRSLKESGLHNIKEIKRHQIKMINVYNRFNETSNHKPTLKLPYIYPSPFLKAPNSKLNENIVSRKTKLKLLKYDQNIVSSEDSNKELPTSGDKVPKLRNIDDSDSSEYMYFVTTSPKYHSSRSTGSTGRRSKRLGLSEQTRAKINSSLEITNEDFERFKTSYSYKWNNEISILNKKMKMNQLDEKYLGILLFYAINSEKLILNRKFILMVTNAVR